MAGTCLFDSTIDWSSDRFQPNLETYSLAQGRLAAVSPWPSTALRLLVGTLVPLFLEGQGARMLGRIG